MLNVMLNVMIGRHTWNRGGKKEENERKGWGEKKDMKKRKREGVEFMGVEERGY